MNQVGAYLPLLLLVLLGYLLLIRPARQRALAAQRLQSALSPGDEVLLTSGMFATVVAVDDEVARVELAPGMVVRVHRRAVGQIVNDVPSAEDQLDDPAPPSVEDPAGDDKPGVN